MPRVGGTGERPLAVLAAHAERELRRVLSEVERGVWQPDRLVEAPPLVVAEPTFHVFAEQWRTEHEREWRASTRADYRWRLENHLLPFFRDHRLRDVTVAEVDRYRAAKLAARPALSPRSINMTLVLLSSVLGAALDRDLIDRNPAAGRRRRVRERKPARSYLDTAEQISALLDAGRGLDAKATRYRHVRRHAMLATLTFAGLRIGELCDLRWQHVDLASGRLRIGSAKTDAGITDITIRPVMRDTLSGLKADVKPPPGAYVFPTQTGGQMTPTNFRRRVLAPAVEAANARLDADDLAPLPERMTPHSLRRTFASVLYALGESPAVVMAEMGHTSPALALAVYAQAMRRDEGATDRLRALVEGDHEPPIGAQADITAGMAAATR